MCFWLKNLCQSSMVHNGCNVNFPTRVSNSETSAVCWRESARWVQLSSKQAAAVDSIHHMVMEGLVLSQEDKPNRHRSATEISHETAVLRSSMHSIIHWTPAQILRTTSCSAVVWSQSHLPSRSLINNLIVCNKSCSIINRKLNNK